MIPIWVFTGLGAFFLASVAGFFSITGLAALYAASFMPVVVMAIGIEYGKIAATFWVHQHYKKIWSGWIIGAVFLIFISMGITSGGVFGFLSKGHIDQGAPISDSNLRIERINNSIDRDKHLIKGAQVRLDQLDKVIDTLIKFEKISREDGARDVLNKQKSERDDLNKTITESNTRIDMALNSRLELSQKVNKVEAKLGPVKFIAKLFNADTDNTVRYFTLAIVLLLDPFAIFMVIMTGISFDRWRERKGTKPGDPIIIEKEVEKIIEVPVEKIVEKEVVKVISEVINEEVPLTMETLTDFLENPEMQEELIDNPELIDEVEKLIQKVKDRDETTDSNVGWIGKGGKTMEFSHKPTK